LGEPVSLGAELPLSEWDANSGFESGAYTITLNPQPDTPTPTPSPPREGLQVQPGKTLELVGGNVTIQGENLHAPGGRVELGGVAGSGTVGLNVEGNNIDLSFPDSVALSDVSLSNSALIDVRAGGGGSIAITARNVTLSQGSRLQAGIEQGLGFAGAQAGDIQLKATDRINIADGNRIRSDVELGGTGNAGNINITTGSLFVAGSSQVASVTSGQGNGGSVNINARDTVSWDGSSDDFESSGTGVEPTGVGNAGNLNITTGSLSLTNAAQLRTRTAGQGNGGNININARDTVSVYEGDVITFLEPAGVGNTGNINITTGSLFLESGALWSFTTAQGDAGSIIINARDTVSLDRGSFIFKQSESSSIRQVGEINITTGSLSLTSGSSIEAQGSEARAGNIKVTVRDAVLIDGTDINGYPSNISINVASFAVGSGGDLSITADSLSLTNGATLSAITDGQGDAGNINITVRDAVVLDGSTQGGTGIFTTVEPFALGNGGTINIRAGSLSLLGDAALAADTNGQGQGGNINLDIIGTLLLSGGRTAQTGESSRITLGVRPQGNSAGGDLHINAGSLVLTNGGLIKVSTQGQGDAGNIDIRADRVEISGSVPSSGLPSGLFTSSDTAGNAGDITINTQTFRIANAAALSARSRGDGQGGDIIVNAARFFEAVNGGQLITNTFGQGRAGNITVNAGEQITITGSDPNYAARLAKFPNPISPLVANAIIETGSTSGLFANTEPNSAGGGGNIQIATGQFTVQQGAQLITSTSGSGWAGDITVNAPDIQLSGATSGLFAETTSDANAGNLTIQPRGNGQSVQVTLQDGAQISASTEGNGRGGTLMITAPESITLTGNGSIIAAETGGRGTGGNLNLQTGTLNIQDQAEVTVSSLGTGSAGSLFVEANQIYLNNQGRIRADTSGGGGDINLQSPLILLRNGSSITTNATGSNNPGGDINIDTDNLVAVPSENSDISANSANFRGGNVTVRANGIFGIEFQEQLTPLSDITATGVSSEFSGTVAIITPGIDPSRGLAELPTQVVDATGVIAQGCRGVQGSSFVVTGRGGLPPTPQQALGDDPRWRDWRTPAVVSRQPNVPANGTLPPSANLPSTKLAMVEATGWMTLPDGQVRLTASAPNVTSSNRWGHPVNCDGS
jgi:large exoprotein involved in heme utilization and adhesion